MAAMKAPMKTAMKKAMETATTPATNKAKTYRRKSEAAKVLSQWRMRGAQPPTAQLNALGVFPYYKIAKYFPSSWIQQLIQWHNEQVKAYNIGDPYVKHCELYLLPTQRMLDRYLAKDFISSLAIEI